MPGLKAEAVMAARIEAEEVPRGRGIVLVEQLERRPWGGTVRVAGDAGGGHASKEGGAAWPRPRCQARLGGRRKRAGVGFGRREPRACGEGGGRRGARDGREDGRLGLGGWRLASFFILKTIFFYYFLVVLKPF
jgi:hypothetical protein